MKVLGLHIMLSATYKRALADERANGYIDGVVKVGRMYRDGVDESWADVVAAFAEPPRPRLVCVDGRRID